MGHTACESVSVIFLLKSPSSRIYWNSYWLPLQDKCKSHSLIFTIYQDAAAHFQQEISLTRTQTPLHLNSIFIVRHSLSSGRREKSCLSRGESWSRRGRWGEGENAKHYWQGIIGWQKCQVEGSKVGRWKNRLWIHQAPTRNILEWKTKWQQTASRETQKTARATNGSGKLMLDTCSTSRREFRYKRAAAQIMMRFSSGTLNF